jgi:hypothetical protein
MRNQMRRSLLVTPLAALLLLVVLVSVATGATARSQAVPQNTSKPTITDSNFQVGDTATAHTGTWSNSPTAYLYQWQRCDVASATNCANIAAANSATYVLTTSDVDHSLVVQVTASNASGAQTASSSPTVVIATKAAPVNTARPAISGTVKQGSTLTADNGSWTGGARSFAYQWQRCDASGNNCQSLAGANAKTYVPTASDVGNTLVVLVTATNPSGSATANSKPTVVVSGPNGPVVTAPPTISGTAAVGQVLTGSQGTWSGGVTGYSYQWQRCDAVGTSCANIVGATGTTYTVTADDIGHTLRFVVTAQNASGSSASTSNQTALVAKPTTAACGTTSDKVTVLAGGVKSVAVADVSSPDRLVVNRLYFTSQKAGNRRLIAAHFHVAETTGNCSVAGASVYAVGLPFGVLTSAPAKASGQNGWVTIYFRTTARTQRGLTVVFVRATKPGESILAGVSTRRLVSFRAR